MSSLWSVITLEKKNHVNVPAFGSSHYILTLCCIFFFKPVSVSPPNAMKNRSNTFLEQATPLRWRNEYLVNGVHSYSESLRSHLLARVFFETTRCACVLGK